MISKSGTNHAANIVISRVRFPDELGLLQTISRVTFETTFALHPKNDPKDLQDHLEKSYSDEKLTEEMQNKESQFYFARIMEDDDNKKNDTQHCSYPPAGYLKLNWGKAQTEEQENPNMLEIERIYVLAEHQGKGIGGAMFDFSVSFAKEKKMEYLWLGVWEDNPKAISFYKKKGFEPFGEHVFQMGSDKQVDVLMKLRL